jgi:endonuclease/exonuclease/phosphatase family metal-dependent hydrolase
VVKVVTINILFEMEKWAQRRELLVEGLAAQQADLIGLQEVKLPEDNSAWLAQQLNMPYVQLVPSKGLDDKGFPYYGGAILSRYPFTQQDTLDLQTQGRVAQYVQVEVDGQPLVFCNGHYYWYPGPHPERVKQVQLLLDWLGKLPPDMPIVAVGDFNGMPETPAIALMRERFTSAYAAYHGHEPEYTCPTPLKKRRSLQRRVIKYLVNAWIHRNLRPWRGTLDYVFINQHLRVRNCQLIFTEPAPNDRTLYPSDHFGIAAELEIVRRSSFQLSA